MFLEYQITSKAEKNRICFITKIERESSIPFLPTSHTISQRQALPARAHSPPVLRCTDLSRALKSASSPMAQTTKLKLTKKVGLPALTFEILGDGQVALRRSSRS